MAWPSPVTAGQTATANQYNALVTAVQTWGGDVDAAGYALKNLGSLVINANGSIDVSAGGFSIKGPVNLTGIEGNGVTATAGDAAAISLYTKSGQNPALVSSKSIVEVRSADTSRLIRLSAVPGQEEFIQPASGRLRLASSVDVDTDLSLGGKLTVGGATQFSAPQSISFGSNWQTWTPSITALSPMTFTGTGYLLNVYIRIGPLLFFHLSFQGNLSGTASGQINFSLPVLFTGPYAQIYGSGNVGSGNSQTNFIALVTSSGGQANLPGNVNFALGNNLVFHFSGFYRCA
jgi:hypothetical protein